MNKTPIISRRDHGRGKNLHGPDHWQKARVWSKTIFWTATEESFRRDYKLVAQINDSSESVMANIAEGFGRGTQGQFITFLGYALGSLDETQSHLCAAYDRQYLSRQSFGDLFQQGTEIRKMTISFVRSMVLPGSGARDFKKIKSWTDEVWETYERITGKPRPEFFQNLKAKTTDQVGEHVGLVGSGVEAKEESKS